MYMNNLQPQVISKCSICNISCKNGKFIKNNLNNYNIYCQNCLNKNNFDILCNKNIKINIKNSDNAPYVTNNLNNTKMSNRISNSNNIKITIKDENTIKYENTNQKFNNNKINRKESKTDQRFNNNSQYKNSSNKHELKELNNCKCLINCFNLFNFIRLSLKFFIGDIVTYCNKIY